MTYFRYYLFNKAKLNPLHTHLKGALSFCQGSLQPPLDLSKSCYLCYHVFNLVGQLRLPEDNVIESLTNVLTAIFLGSPGQLLLVLHQPNGVSPQPLSTLSRRFGLPVVVLVGFVPLFWGEAGAQYCPI